jgi:hypothetical protein
MDITDLHLVRGLARGVVSLLESSHPTAVSFGGGREAAMEQRTAAERLLNRRRFLVGGAGIVAGAGLTSALGRPAVAWAARPALPGAVGIRPTPPAPEPIPSVIDPGLPIHLQIPGPTDITLLYSQTTLFGLNLERTPVGNFSGTVALAYLLGTARGSDGVEYGLEVDIRASEGEYVAADGSLNRGLFALI